jgi:hypothetical protein
MSDMVKRLRHRARFDTCEPPEKLMQEAAGEIERLRAGLDAAIRCSELALFVIRKQGIMPNSSWENGFNSDLAKAKAARADNGQLEDERK